MKPKRFEIDPPPLHLMRHKEVYDRHMAGEYLTEIAKDMGISNARAKQLFDRWQRQIFLHNRAKSRERGTSDNTSPLDNAT